jgi:hypothetical protein
MNRILIALLLMSLAGGDHSAAARLDVYPPEVQLSGAVSRQRLLAVLTRDDGVTEDVTGKARFALTDAKLARLDRQALFPVADGQTTLIVEHVGQKVTVPVRISGATMRRPTSFKLDVMPVFMRAGCNTGGCHGSARGQDGFRLSLFGFDPDGDHFRLTREMPDRRINLALPGESLLLEKATGMVPHTGGKRFGSESEYYATVLAWLEAGAPADAGQVPTVDRVEIYPPQAVLEGVGAQQPMIVCAAYSDGSVRDVTHLAVFLSNNDTSAAIDAEGLVKAGAPGEAFVMARFSTHTVGSQVIVLSAGLKYAAPNEPPANYVDELVAAKLRKLRIVPSPVCDDRTFLRRVTLDISGRLPTPEEYLVFLANKAGGKRARLIDRLLAEKEFSQIWAMKWAELLMIRSSVDFSYKSMFLYWDWLGRKVADNVPVDQMVRELLSSSGGTFRNPATNFYQIERDTLKTAENVAQVFMGIRVQCAQCHNHPFDRWTMNDYYGFAAFFSQVGRKPAEDYRESIVFNAKGGQVRHPVTGQVMAPKFLGGPAPDIKDRDRRAVLAEWLTSPDNPYFATSIANRIWEHFLGIGIVQPVDDVRVSNPPCNPQLLDALGRKLIEYKYDFKRLVRDITNSRTYQRSTRPDTGNVASARNFAEGRVRRLRSEVLSDAITQVTETKDKFRGLPLGARAVEIADGTTSTYFLTTFGRTPRETVCAADVRTEPTLSQALNLLNGEVVGQKIAAGGVVRRMLAAKQTPDQVIRELYVRSLTREPTPAELERLRGMIRDRPQRQQALEDVFWSILNSREFLFNH